MTMKKLLIIGIDSVDKKLLKKWKNELPNFRRFLELSPEIELQTIFPPDTPPSWITIHSGLNPANHGVMNFVNPAAKSGKVKLMDVSDSSAYQGKTYWDIAGQYGKKVCVLLPNPVFPAWDVNGIMICRTPVVSTRDFPLSVFPDGIDTKYSISPARLNLPHGLPSQRQRGLEVWFKKQQQTLESETELFCNVLGNEEWDLSFVYFSSLDGVQHAFWSSCDESHPDYVHGTKFSNAIKDFYKLQDEAVGELIKRLGSDTTIALLSDHGHQMRPMELVNVNEILRSEGFLVARSEGNLDKAKANITNSLKNLIFRMVSRVGVTTSLRRLLDIFPLWKRVFASHSPIDWEKTIAYVSDLSVVKSYPYGGVVVERKGMSDAEYKETRDRILHLLDSVRDPANGKKLIKWLKCREEVYKGEYLHIYPDIVLETEDDYALGWGIHQPVVTPNPMYKVQPGCHKGSDAVFFILNSDRECARSRMNLVDVTPTVLDLLGIESDFSFDGKSIFKA